MAKKPLTHIDSELLGLNDRHRSQPRRVLVSRKGVVATAHYRATEAGTEMLEAGGNALTRPWQPRSRWASASLPHRAWAAKP
jgi:hypothetical protein